MVKELALEVISKLPNDVTMEQIMEELYIRANVLKGIDDAKNGDIISQEDFLKEIEEW